MSIKMRLGACCLAVLMPALAHAEDQPDGSIVEQQSRFSASGVLEFQFDTIVIADAVAGTGHESAITSGSTLDMAVDISKGLSLQSTAVFEQVRGSVRNQYFSAHGLYAETLTLQYTDDNFTLFAGKLDPSFGTAWDVAPGLYGTEFAEEYQLTERIGFGGDINLGHAFGVDTQSEHVLSASLYKADTSILSDSLFTRRGHAHHVDGGLSNSKSLSSFSLALDGSDVAGVSGLEYHVALRSQAAGLGSTRREKGLVGGFSYAQELASGHALEIVTEVAHLWHADGFNNHDVTIGTVGAVVAKGEWSFSAGYSGRLTRRSSLLVGAPDSHQAHFSIGHDLGRHFSIEGGWKTTWGNSYHTGVLGMLIAYEFG